MGVEEATKWGPDGALESFWGSLIQNRCLQIKVEPLDSEVCHCSMQSTIPEGDVITTYLTYILLTLPTFAPDPLRNQQQYTHKTQTCMTCYHGECAAWVEGETAIKRVRRFGILSHWEEWHSPRSLTSLYAVD